jgi:hypothetical protein
MMTRWVLAAGVALGLGWGCGDDPERSEAGDTAGADVGSEDSGGADVSGGADTADSGDAGDASDTADTADAEVPVLAPVEGEPNFAVAANGWYRGDLHYHTDYSEDAKKQGGDPLWMCVEIADGYRAPEFLAAYPELAGNDLDYIAITDHRTDIGLSDPAFTHERLILVPGEEYGGSGHANIFGLKAHIPHDPQAGESQNQRHLDAIAEAHAQGAVFSVNHPVDENNWVWDTPTLDAVEIWNGPWAGFYLGSTLEELDGDVAGAGVENAFSRDALEGGTGGINSKGMRFWQNHLTAGIHIPAVGGSDRHMIVPAALPTTYVRRPSDPKFDGLEGPALGMEGIVAGIAEGGTFISRSPFGPQIDLHAEGPDGTLFPLGSELPGVGTYRIHIRVSRADGGIVRLIAGPLRAAVDGRVSAEDAVVFEEPVTAAFVEGTFDWEVPAEGGWLHAVVLEPVAKGELPPEGQQVLDLFQSQKEADGLTLMAEAILPLADVNLIFDPGSCDPAEWEAWRPQCMPIDDMTLPTFYLPDELVRMLNIYFEDGAPTDLCMGAVSSAFMARP